MRASLAGRVGAVLLAAGLLVGRAAPAAAQYFGQNKVQFENFKFSVLKTEHFDIYFYPSEEQAAQMAGRIAERSYARLARVFDHQLSGRQPLILYASQPDFQQTNAISGQLGEGTGGVTEALKRRIVLPIGGTLGELNHVIGHELVHAFQYDMTGLGRSGARNGLPGAAALPLWFIEGMAEYFSLGPDDPNTAMWMRDATDHKIPDLGDLEDPAFFPYRYGQALLAYLGGMYGDESVAALLRTASARRGMADAAYPIYHQSLDTLIAAWHDATRKAYEPLHASTHEPGDYGPVLFANKDHAGAYNVSPAVSPDGSKVMYLSDRGLFSIDIYLADARTGKELHQVTSTALDPHFQSLEFINSAGDWDPTGHKFVFAGLVNATPVLDLYDVDKARIERELKFPGLGEILNPSWSPDGRYLAFSGLTGGFSDLFVYDLQADSLRQLTNDVYGDISPVWSPDGKTLAFSTDRFTTSLKTLEPGPMQLAAIDVATGEIRQLPAIPGAKMINPQWAPGGKSIYFVSDRGGISNIYRLDLANGSLNQVTDLFTGVSGITALSPAISVAQGTGRILYSSFRKNGFIISAIEPSATPAGGAVAAVPPGTNAAMLPPRDRRGSLILGLLNDSTIGLPPADTTFAVVPYSSGLSLDYLGQPTLVAGASRFGTYLGGGVALFFSDMLGNHNLTTLFQVNGGLRDITALVGYTNLSHRLNWGVVAQQVPYVVGSFAEGITTDQQGRQVIEDQELLYRETDRQVEGLLSYPFSRTSRVELQAGGEQIAFSQELRTQTYDIGSGQQLTNDRVDLPAPSAINLLVGSAALVYDNAFYGATGPILGRRYRLELAPNVGTINFVNALADIRQYIMPVRPFTLAFRLLHYGRYGKNSEDNRLYPLFLGEYGLVRGYTYGSFNANECVPTSTDPNACPVFDQLVGSRLGVGNAELRFPLFGALGVGSGYYGVFPVDMIVFGDAGVAWNSGSKPDFLGGSRKTVFSAGTGLRINLFGFAIGEVDLVHPFQRPGRNWLWQFSLQPGF